MASTFDFEKELTKVGKSLEDFESFLEEDGESFNHFSEETVKKIYILQEKTMATVKELGLDSDVLADAMTNLVFNY